MVILIRADASIQIGSGHIMRTLILADILKKQGHDIIFISREIPGQMCDYVEKKGYKVHRLIYNKEKNELKVNIEQDIFYTKLIITKYIGYCDWLIVDHYEINEEWENELKNVVKKIFVIDDFTNRKHNCDIILNQNWNKSEIDPYQTLIPNPCRRLLGKDYLLFRSEFIEEKSKLRYRNGIIKRILISYGGSDWDNETEKAINAVMTIKTDMFIDVVIGNSNPHKEKLEQLIHNQKNINFYCQIDHIAKLINAADLAIGSSGISAWERCFLGLPSVTTISDQNQLETYDYLTSFGAIWNIGWAAQVTVADLSERLKNVINNPPEIHKIQHNALELMKVSGNGPQIIGELIEEKA